MKYDKKGQESKLLLSSNMYRKRELQNAVTKQVLHFLGVFQSEKNNWSFKGKWRGAWLAQLGFKHPALDFC